LAWILGHEDKTVTAIYTRTAAKPLIGIVQVVNDPMVEKAGLVDWKWECLG